MDKQIYSATYSNVPVFEFVTSEGPVMRRKLDSYINATHILKIAKFPKAKRTRILEKDVQTRTHDKVQGGYGKYQGTYVPLEIGEEIAKNFGIYEELKPIFDFTYIEGRSQTPPPAPKHSHASASNLARKQALAQAASGSGSKASLSAATRNNTSINNKQLSSIDESSLARKTKSMSAIPGEPPRKRGRPKRESLQHQPIQQPFVPSLNRTNTVPIKDPTKGPSIGTFNNSRNNSLLKSSQNLQNIQQFSRQDTDQDALQLMVNSLNVQNEDLEVAERSSDDELGRTRNPSPAHQDASLDDEDDENDELMTGHELFGSPRNSFEKIVQSHNHNSQQLLQVNGSSFNSYPAYAGAGSTGLNQYHHLTNVGGSVVGGIGGGTHTNSSTNSVPTPVPTPSNAISLEQKESNVYTEYFTNLLNYFLEDSNNNSKLRSEKASTVPHAQNVKAEVVPTSIPVYILKPPQPLSKINISQPVDNDGNSILHWACSMANTNMIEFLLAIFHEYLNATIKNIHGETPLMFLTRFSNSFQLKNFPTLLDLLFDSILSIDNSGRTILHHIAIAATANRDGSGGHGNGSISSFQGEHESALYVTYKKNKEKFGRYYMETLFAKIIEFQDYKQDSNGKTNNSGTNGSAARDNKSELIAKVINHQDINGNTAFHIVAYNLNKKLIKVFISYHKYIDFTLKNLVSYTVEEYLASHNYILRLGNSVISQDSASRLNSTNGLDATSNTPSFENQLFVSKTAMNSLKSSSNTLNEKLLELNYAIDKELSEKDEKLLLYYKILKFAKSDKLQSQKNILKFFKLEHLIDDQDYDDEVYRGEKTDKIEEEGKETRDSIIQGEINRLVNDLSYEYLKRKDELDKKLKIYKSIANKVQGDELKKLEAINIKQGDGKGGENGDGDLQERNKLALNLQLEILKRKKLLNRLVLEQLKVPITINDKENRSGANASSAADSSGNESIVAKYPKDDKLNKYCKLISLCCGMNFNDVEKLIDLIEQSLSKTNSQQPRMKQSNSSL